MYTINNIVTEYFPEASMLASGAFGRVYALSDSIVVKALEDAHVLTWQVADESYQPIDKLAAEWANNYNNLVVKFEDWIHIRDEEENDDVGDLIIMERVYPCLPTAFTVEELEAAVDVAEQQLNELWSSGFAHCDLKRPEFIKKVYNTTSDDLLYNNIVLTKVNGVCIIRLIDIGNANLEQYDVKDKIEDNITKDKIDWEDFKEWLFTYPRQH